MQRIVIAALALVPAATVSAQAPNAGRTLHVQMLGDDVTLVGPRVVGFATNPHLMLPCHPLDVADPGK